MANSNVKKLRKKYAADISDEIATINHELESQYNTLKGFDYKSLRVLDLKQLKNLRNEIQYLKSKIERINTLYAIIVSDKLRWPQVGIPDGNGKIIAVDSHRLHIAQVTDQEFDSIPTAQEVRKMNHYQ